MRFNEASGMSRRRLFRTAGAAAVSGLALGVGSGVMSPRPVLAHEGEEAVALEIHLGEMFFQVHERNGEAVDAAKNAPVELRAGQELQVRFENVGNVEHEIHFGRNAVKNDEGQFVEYEQTLFGGGFRGLHLLPGQSGKLHMEVPAESAGEWEMGCFIPGHYEAGMKAPLNVVAE